MANLGEILRLHGELSPIEVEWLHLLVVDWQVVADLSFSDLVLWVDDGEGGFVVAAHCRPSTGVTVHQDDLVGDRLPQGRIEQMRRALSEGMIQHSVEPRWTGSYAVREDLVPVVCNGRPIAVMAREANLGIARSPSRLEVNYLALADDLCAMVSRGEFPQTSAPGTRRGGPRVGDGIVRIDTDGVVMYASPNAMSCFHRLGLPDPLVGKVLASAISSRIEVHSVVDESLPVVLMGRAAWQSEVESHGVALSMRAIPLTEYGQRRGAIIMVRDVSEIRLRERELMSKDATIREIHHRVKNNLQTVSALLRLQARRSESPEVKAALAEAQRRVATIAVVHENLSQTITETVNFDELLDRILSLAADVARRESRVVTRVEGSVGMVPSSVATSLAVVVTELVSNAVEHGLRYQSGTVTITAHRDGDDLELHVIDDGAGLEGEALGSGLGTQIVRTLVAAELRGTIGWTVGPDGGTDVTLHAHLA
ncbi:MAG TPA: PAS domain-containing protein [Actinomycetales bacterium]|nr:PAS domain-containing protein [Actinomycetales bacterium]